MQGLSSENDALRFESFLVRFPSLFFIYAHIYFLTVFFKKIRASNCFVSFEIRRYPQLEFTSNASLAAYQKAFFFEGNLRMAPVMLKMIRDPEVDLKTGGCGTMSALGFLP